MNEHKCHAEQCNIEVPPKLLMCAKHWWMVPRAYRTLIHIYFRPGQEVDKQPTAQYLAVMKLAINSVAEQEKLPVPFPSADEDFVRVLNEAEKNKTQINNGKVTQ